MNMNKKKFVAIGPLPPPLGGDTISFSRLVNSDSLKVNSISLLVHNTSRGQEGYRRSKIDLSDIKNSFNILKYCYKNINTVEGVLIWANTRFSYTIGLLIILMYKSKKKKVILKHFGASFFDRYEKLSRMHQKIIKYVFKKVDYILPQTQELCKSYRNIVEIPDKKIVHFPNFINAAPKFYEPALGKKQIKTVFISRVMKEKGVFDILEMLKLNEEIECDFYGPVFNKDEALFFEKLKKLKNARYCGIIQNDEVISTISNYDILMLPSYYRGEGYPGVVLESFFASRPVLVTNWKSLPEIVENNKDGFIVDIKSPNEIADKLKEIINNKDFYLQMCLKSNKKAKMFTEKTIINEILVPLLSKNKGD